MTWKFLLPKIFVSGCVLLFTGCLMDYGAPEDTEPGEVTLDVRLEATNVLAKAAEGQLQCLVVLLTSNKGDTLIDSITPEGSTLSPEPVFLFRSASREQVLTLHYALAPGRTWKVRAHLYDTRDSLRQADSITIAKVKAFDVRRLPLQLHSRFSPYAAELFLPSEVRVLHQGAGETRKIFFTRVRLEDGKKVLRDTSSYDASGAGFLVIDTSRLHKAAGLKYFAPGNPGTNPLTLVHEYAASGIETYTLEAYGYLEGDTLGVTPERLLYKGSHATNTAQASDPETLSLDWQPAEAGATLDPDSQDVGFKVMLGRVGTVVMNVQISGAVDL